MPLVNPAVKGGVTLLAEGTVGSPRISGNGRVVVWNELVDDNLEIMKYENGTVTRLTTDPRPDMHADLSHDGKVIAWERWSSLDPNDKNGHFDVIQWRDGVESSVAAGAANEMDARVSRDGKVLVWNDDSLGRWGHWRIMKWENGVVEQVSDDGQSAEFPFLTGDGQRIYWRVDGSDTNAIYMRDETGKIAPAVDAPSWHVTPCVTPDGTKLLWTDDMNGDEDLLMLADGNASVVAGERQVDETWGTMSADGKTVAWTNFDRRGKRDGERADVDVYMKEGEESTRVTIDGGMHSFPSISDDGQRMVWMNVITPRHVRIWLLERDKEPLPDPPVARGAHSTAGGASEAAGGGH